MGAQGDGGEHTARTADLKWWKGRPVPDVPYYTASRSVVKLEERVARIAASAHTLATGQMAVRITLCTLFILLVAFSFLLPSPLYVFSCLTKFFMSY